MLLDIWNYSPRPLHHCFNSSIVHRMHIHSVLYPSLMLNLFYFQKLFHPRLWPELVSSIRATKIDISPKCVMQKQFRFKTHVLWCSVRLFFLWKRSSEPVRRKTIYSRRVRSSCGNKIVVCIENGGDSVGGVRLTHCGVGGGGESRLPISSAVAVAYFHRRRRQVLKSRPATRPNDLTIVEPSSPVFFPSSGFFSMPIPCPNH